MRFLILVQKPKEYGIKFIGMFYITLNYKLKVMQINSKDYSEELLISRQEKSLMRYIYEVFGEGEYILRVNLPKIKDKYNRIKRNQGYYLFCRCIIEEGKFIRISDEYSTAISLMPRYLKTSTVEMWHSLF